MAALQWTYTYFDDASAVVAAIVTAAGCTRAIHNVWDKCVHASPHKCLCVTEYESAVRPKRVASSADCGGFYAKQMISNDVHTLTYITYTRGLSDTVCLPACHPSEGKRERQKKQKKSYLEWNKLWRSRYMWAYACQCDITHGFACSTDFTLGVCVHALYFSVSSSSLDEPTTTTTSEKKLL